MNINIWNQINKQPDLDIVKQDGRALEYIENNFFIREVKVSAQIAFGLSE